MFQSRMEPALQLPKAQALRLLSSLPRGRPHDNVAWVVPSAGSGARFSQTRDPDGVQVRGIGRLAVLRALMRHVRQLTIFRDPRHEEVSAWQLDLAAQRMTVVLSPGVYRGFSGEGQVLFSLAASTDDGLLEAVDEQLCWQSALNAQNVATLLDVSTQTAKSALVCLGAEGLMGYDFRDQGFFHRELPFDREKVELRNPRLVGARALLKRNSVSWLSEGQLAEVHSEGQIYRVELQPQPPHRCNCQWYAKYQGRRGTCDLAAGAGGWRRTRPHGSRMVVRAGRRSYFNSIRFAMRLNS